MNFLSKNKKKIIVIIIIIFIGIIFICYLQKQRVKEEVQELKEPQKIAVLGIDEQGMILPEQKCQNMSGKKKEECLDKWINAKAIGQTKNLKECVLIKDISKREECIYRIARERKNIRDCERITDHKIKERCIGDVGIFQRDEKICDHFSNEPHEKQECIDRTKAFKYGDSGETNKCSEIQTLEYSGLCIQNAMKTSGQKCKDLATEELRKECGALLMYPLADTIEECENLPLENYKKVCLIQIKNPDKKYYEIDSDEDKIEDKLELWIQTDPFNSDTDGDGLTDGEEFLTYHTNPVNSDTDGDGLTDYDEIKKYYTHPQKPDTDGDGYLDGQEVEDGYDPHTGDSDKDGLFDADEIKFGTDIKNPDTDGDGISDFEETRNGYNPLGEGLADTDDDGLLDIDEVFYGTDRFNPDTDNDGINDKKEVDDLTNPLGQGNMDFDEDGLTDKEEEKYQTNPSLSDTDGDGYLDGEEVENGYNPLGEGKME